MAGAEWTMGSIIDNIRVILMEARKDGLHPTFQLTTSL